MELTSSRQAFPRPRRDAPRSLVGLRNGLPCRGTCPSIGTLGLPRRLKQSGAKVREDDLRIAARISSEFLSKVVVFHHPATTTDCT